MMVPVFIANGGFLYAFAGVLFVLAFAWGVLMLLGSGVESLFSRKAREMRKIGREGRRLAKKAGRELKALDDYFANDYVPTPYPMLGGDRDDRPEGRHFAD